MLVALLFTGYRLLRGGSRRAPCSTRSCGRLSGGDRGGSATLLIFATLGEMFLERAGFNLGIEGIRRFFYLGDDVDSRPHTFRGICGSARRRDGDGRGARFLHAVLTVARSASMSPASGSRFSPAARLFPVPVDLRPAVDASPSITSFATVPIPLLSDIPVLGPVPSTSSRLSISR